MIENKLLSNNQIFHLEISKLMQRLELDFIPSPFVEIFKNQERSSSMSTRSSSSYFQSFMFAHKCQQCISYSGPLTWGTVPTDVRVSQNETDLIISSDRWDPAVLDRKSRLMKNFTKKNESFLVTQYRFHMSCFASLLCLLILFNLYTCSCSSCRFYYFMFHGIQSFFYVFLPNVVPDKK